MHSHLKYYICTMGGFLTHQGITTCKFRRCTSGALILLFYCLHRDKTVPYNERVLDVGWGKEDYVHLSEEELCSTSTLMNENLCLHGNSLNIISLESTLWRQEGSDRRLLCISCMFTHYVFFPIIHWAKRYHFSHWVSWISCSTAGVIGCLST